MNQEPLFHDSGQTQPANAPDKTPEHTERVVASALWAAWADALGFISELTSEAGLRRRLRGQSFDRPREWVRRVGGKGGPDVVLPAGTYSDDTQLRLATGRCIGPHGHDVEAFAHVELPAWLAYALGGGVGTKSAAARMMKPNAVWYAGRPKGWIHAGGNGAAMRIQPHVWASRPDIGRVPWLGGLLADACTTHAHPRAILGAVFHAYALRAALSDGRAPRPESWHDLLAVSVDEGINAMESHPEIGDYWIGAFDQAAREEDLHPFRVAWFDTANEIDAQLKVAQEVIGRSTTRGADADQGRYSRLVNELRLTDERTRGSGASTVTAALALAWLHDQNPLAASQAAASAIGTDTDTIATMAAAIAGATTTELPTPPDEHPDYSDTGYIVSEATRLAQIATGESAPSPRYPDLLGWSLPKVQADMIGFHHDSLWLAGVSKLTPTERPPSKRGDFNWQWHRTEWNQHVLVKMRNKIKELPDGLLPVSGFRDTSASGQPAELPASATLSGSEQAVSLELVLNWLNEQQFSDQALAYAVRRMAQTAASDEFSRFSQTLFEALRRK